MIIKRKKDIKIFKSLKKIYHIKEQISVFARIVGKRTGVLLGYEKVTCNGNEGKQEFESNVGIKLVKKLKDTYGRGIDVIVGDAIYLRANVIKSG